MKPETDLSAGFTQDTGVMNVAVSYQNDGGGTGISVESSDKQYFNTGEPFAEFSGAEISGTGSGALSTTTVDFGANTAGYSDNVENVSFRLSDIDTDDEIDNVTIIAYDADGNIVPVALSQTSNGDDVISDNQVTGANGTDNPDSESGSVLVNIAGPVSLIEIIYENDGTGSGSIGVSNIHFETTPANDNDSLTGGDGDDLFVYADGNNTITDFNFGNTGTLDDGDSTNNDFIDLSGHYDHISELYADQADDGILNQSNTTDTRGQTTDYSDNTQFNGGSMTFSGASADESSFTDENTGVVCFADGTAIRTPNGDVPVEDLRPGDLITTRNGHQRPLRWVGVTALDLVPGSVDPARTPVRIKPLQGHRALLVSPQHCLLMQGPDGAPVFVRARHLAEETRFASFARGRATVHYHHLLLDSHDIVISEGRPSESFYPGRQSMKMMPAAERTRLLFAAPHINPAAPEEAYGSRALTVLKRREVKAHTRNATLHFADIRIAAIAC